MKKILLTIMCIGLFGLANSQSINDPFFDKVHYIGAFDGMNDWTEGWAEWNPVNKDYPAHTVTKGNGVFTLAGGLKITADETWSGVILLDGWVYVEAGATLTIQPGTIIRGTEKSALVITKGAKIHAAGTKESPIVFTSSQGAGLRSTSDWGGIVICGNGIVNTPSGEKIAEGGVGVSYGGTNNADNSGVLKYVRIEFTGFEVSTGSELNGLSMCAVGSGTIIDHIQVSYAGDDGFEWWGGAVNAKYLISYKTEDDDFDTDNGFVGMIQFAVALRDSEIVDTDTANGFESDNDDTGSDNMPYTNAIFSNVSAFGPSISNTNPATLPTNHNEGAALRIRRASRLQIYNSVFAGYGRGLRLESTSGWNAAQTDLLTVQNTILAGIRNDIFKSGATGVTDAQVGEWFLAPARKNSTLTLAADLKLVNPFSFTSPNFKPESASPVLDASYWFTPSVGTPKLESAFVSDELSSYPNPFTETTYIDLSVNVKTEVRAMVYDLNGKLVAELYNGIMHPGVGTLEFNAKELPRGFYIGRITAGNKVYTVKMIAK
jgi:hypothetical protein